MMNNSKLFPFERNKYYYGKLLSVNDFELEQKYVNDKRRVINRLLHGYGVVAGLYVLGIDDFTVSVERGLALDYSGREMIIDNPVIKKLSMIDGYQTYEENHKDQGYMYLCLEYQEEDVEPVYNAAGNNKGSSEQAFDKIKEGYRLFLTGNEPSTDYLSPEDFYMNTKTIYWGNGIRIQQKLQRFVQSSQEALLKIEIENMGQQKLFAFSYELQLLCLSHGGHSNLKVSFNEAFFEKSGRYELVYTLNAHDVVDTQGMLTLEEGSFVLSIEQHAVEAAVTGKQSILICSGDEKQELIQAYYQENMEVFIKNNYQQSIYLAKISLLQAGESYAIQSVENMPFHQYVAGNELLCVLYNTAQQKGLSTDKTQKEYGLEHEGASERDYGLRFAQGEAVIFLGDKIIRGKKFISEDISHDLGVGQTTIVLSVINDSEEIYGEAGIFDKVEPMVALAACADKDKGSFKIGVKVLSESMKNEIRVHWSAFKDTREYINEKKEQKIFIKPNVLNLKTRESYYLEAVCTNMKDKRLKWSVRDNCGTVDNNGMYTAPNTTGVFEVIVQSVTYPEVRASIFVIVREAIDE